MPTAPAPVWFYPTLDHAGGVRLFQRRRGRGRQETACHHAGRHSLPRAEPRGGGGDPRACRRSGTLRRCAARSCVPWRTSARRCGCGSAAVCWMRNGCGSLPLPSTPRQPRRSGTDAGGSRFPPPKAAFEKDVSFLRSQAVWHRRGRKAALPTHQNLWEEVLVAGLHATKPMEEVDFFRHDGVSRIRTGSRGHMAPGGGPGGGAPWRSARRRLALSLNCVSEPRGHPFHEFLVDLLLEFAAFFRRHFLAEQDADGEAHQLAPERAILLTRRLEFDGAGFTLLRIDRGGGNPEFHCDGISRFASGECLCNSGFLLGGQPFTGPRFRYGRRFGSSCHDFHAPCKATISESWKRSIRQFSKMLIKCATRWRCAMATAEK